MARISPLVVAPLALIAAFAAMAALGYWREAGQGDDAAPAAPPVALVALPGKTGFDDATLRDGRVKLVNYWASWCVPCRVEHPNLMTLAEEGLPVYGVNYKDAPDKALAFLTELGDPYRAVGADPEGRMAETWGVFGLPETYVLDGAGRVILRFTGPVTKRVLRETIRPAIAAAQKG